MLRWLLSLIPTMLHWQIKDTIIFDSHVAPQGYSIDRMDVPTESITLDSNDLLCPFVLIDHCNLRSNIVYEAHTTTFESLQHQTSASECLEIIMLENSSFDIRVDNTIDFRFDPFVFDKFTVYRPGITIQKYVL
jgi:hypothetical protein